MSGCDFIPVVALESYDHKLVSADLVNVPEKILFTRPLSVKFRQMVKVTISELVFFHIC